MRAGRARARVLELGTGTGETARRLLEAHPDAFLVGVDESASMLAVARLRCRRSGSTCRVGAIEEPLPEGPFDLVASALCVHHLTAPRRLTCFGACCPCLRPGGGSCSPTWSCPSIPADATTSLTPGFDRPSSLADQVAWLRDAGFEVRVCW